MAFGSLNAKANVAVSQTDDVSLAIAGRTGKRVVVQAVYLMAGATATAVTFNTKPAGAGTAISATFQCGANGGATLPFAPGGWFVTNSGEALSVTTGAGSTVGIGVIYDYVSA